MSRTAWILLAVSMLLIVAALALVFIPAPAKAPPAPPQAARPGPVTHNDLIRVTSPLPGESISSPVIITGQARGNWYFEAQFPVQVLDATGKIIGQTPATAQGDWMTANYVPFQATVILTTTPAAGSSGTILLKKDNPSGDPARDDSVRVPVVFQ